MGLVVSGNEVVKALQKLGFISVSQRGSHLKMKKESLTVIVPLHDELRVGTLRSILRQASISTKDLEELL